MGACELNREFEGTTTEAQIKAWFDEASKTAAIESGNSYSGDWNMFSGISFRYANNDPFKTEAEALAFLADTAEKWEAAIAVKFYRTTGDKKPTFNNSSRCDMYFPSMNIDIKQPVVSFRMGQAINASNPREMVAADQLNASDQKKALKYFQKLRNYYCELRLASDTLEREVNKFKVLTAEPTSNGKDLLRLRNAAKKAHGKYCKAHDDFVKVNNELAPKVYSAGSEKKLLWLVGGFAAC